jgi:hypothetical protein
MEEERKVRETSETIINLYLPRVILEGLKYYSKFSLFRKTFGPQIFYFGIIQKKI